jgi:hypothetical protein
MVSCKNFVIHSNSAIYFFVAVPLTTEAYVCVIIHRSLSEDAC